MDPRARQAVDASLSWYDDVFAMHGLPTSRSETLWRSLAEPPPYHSVAKTIVASVPVDEILRATDPFAQCTVADSFGDLRLPGFSELVKATWVHHPGGRPTGMPVGWQVVSTVETLELWCERHDYVGVLPAALLQHPRFRVLGRFTEDEELVAGAVLHDGGGTVDVSNTWAAGGGDGDCDELVAVIRAMHPGRPLTGYAVDHELTTWVQAGFAAVGPQLVWVR